MRTNLSISVLHSGVSTPADTTPPDEGGPAASTIMVDTSSNDGAVNPFTWGIQAPNKYMWYAHNSEGVNVTARLLEAGIKLVRVNPIQNMLYSGRDPYPAASTWNLSDMDDVLKIIFNAGAEPLFIICDFPAGVPHTEDGSNNILTADWTAYATFMRGIVKRYNTDQVLGAGKKIRYWEMWNEPSNEGDGKFTSFTQYKDFVQTVGNAMKAEDPTIKLIGPAWGHSDVFVGSSEVSMSAKQLEAQLDLLSWHDYGPDFSATDADRLAWTVEHYYNRPLSAKQGGPGDIFKGTGGKLYGAAITEYNMSQGDGGATYNLKYHNEFNAIYVASAIVNAMKAGTDIFTYYAIVETGANHLGVLSNSTFEPYKPFYSFYLFGKCFGNRKVTATGSVTNLEFVASVDTTTGKTYIIVVNKDLTLTRAISVGLQNIASSSGTVTVRKLDATTNPTSTTTIPYTARQFTYSIPPLTVVAFEI